MELFIFCKLFSLVFGYDFMHSDPLLWAEISVVLLMKVPANKKLS